MREKVKVKKKFNEFSQKEQDNIVQNRNDIDGKEIISLILNLYKKFLPLLFIFLGFILLGATLIYYFY